MSDAAPIAEIRSYDDLVSALIARKTQLGVTMETIDEISGLARGHTSKLLAPMRPKRIGLTSLGLLLGALGCKLVMVEDGDAVRAVQSRLLQRRTPLHSGAVEFRLSRKFMSRIGAKGGANSRKRVPKWRRIQIAKKIAAVKREKKLESARASKEIRARTMAEKRNTQRRAPCPASEMRSQKPCA